MTSIGNLRGCWIIAVVTLLGADFGVTIKRPRSDPNVPFPPACPTSDNLANLCNYSNERPRYQDSFFPASGASHFRRRGHAINRMESWYSSCCGGLVEKQPSEVLCCAKQAWKQALSQFCVEEYSTMTMAYECCQYKGDARWICFDSELPNPDYSPIPGYTAPEMPPELGFTFDPTAC
ncbi:extracellular matrix protein 1-like [Melanotaenia boesemani]|uniref:extracellular matrix protein 1-like n=1 Tax=Melanotaenia boesemani TaxID=1250792 RepID=UPI001C04432E|nr:extracellular matrix protein 1-like [Melanotaenia boesemani]